MAIRLVVGLGNPGPEYERTRHNVGFRLVDRMVDEAASSWKAFQEGVVARAGELWLAKPMTYMNESGRFVRAFAGFHKMAPSEILVVYDEIALPLGKIRIRAKGSAGGQNGMKSVIAHLGTDAVPRLRIGIGPQPERVDAADFVLSRFSGGQEKELDAVLALAAEAVGFLRENGVDLAMTRYNPAAAA